MWIVLITGIVFISVVLLKSLIVKRGLFPAILFLACLFPGLGLIYIAYNLGSFRVFNEQEPLCVIECKPVKGEISDMVFSMNYMSAKESMPGEKFLLTGNQWAIEGNIIKWMPPFNLQDVYLYKIARIKARFLNPRNEKQSPGIVYNIGGAASLWSFLNKHKFAFIEAVYANSAYNFADKKAKFYLYADDSGFIIKKERTR